MQAEKRWERPPVNEIPAHADIRGVLNRSDDLVIRLAATEVFSRCVSFRFAAHKRIPTASMSTYGFGRPESLKSSSAQVLIGFEWSDGSASTNLPMSQNNAGGLHAGSGGGSSINAEWLMHLDHLPPVGVFSVITAWPYFDLAEHVVTFDAGKIADAARTVESLWDEPEFVAPSQAVPDKPDNALTIPETGWFADHYDATPRPRADGMVWRFGGTHD